jgi:hypothetical protein
MHKLGGEACSWIVRISDSWKQLQNPQCPEQISICRFQSFTKFQQKKVEIACLAAAQAWITRI